MTAGPPEHADRGRYLSNLGLALVHEARLSDKASDSGEAIDVIAQALEVVGPDDPGRADTLLAMGAACARAFQLGDSAAFSRGLEAFGEATGMEIASSTARIRAGRDGGRLAASGRAFDEALSAFGTAVRLIEEAAWAGMGEGPAAPAWRAERAAHGRGSDGDRGWPSGRSGGLLERGRGVLLARQFDAPGLHAKLKALAPEIAEQLARVQASLNDAGQDSGPAVATDRNLAARRSLLARRRAAILDRPRADPGLQGLVGPPHLGELLSASSQGPVVIVNISEYRCDALILSAGQVRAVPLPLLTGRAVAEQVGRLLEAADAMKSGEIDEVLGVGLGLRR